MKPSLAAVKHALRLAQVNHHEYYHRSNTSEGLCICLPCGETGDWLRGEIRKMLKGYVYVTDWLYDHPEGRKLIIKEGGLTEKLIFSYRNAWIKHLTQFYSKHLKD